MAEQTDQMNATSPADANADERPIAPELRRKVIRHELQDPVPSNAVARTTPGRLERALELARACARIADENRGKDILLLDLRPATPLVDFFVIVTATSRRLGNAIAEEVDKEMKRRGERKLGIEGSEEGRWTLIDYGDFVVHVFSAEARTYYSLEDIWGDAPHLDWQDPARRRPRPATTEDNATEAETGTATATEEASGMETGLDDEARAEIENENENENEAAGDPPA
jgi:ribosome-associated protein